jgi:nucleotide-binding universal stress UspA family protein
MHDGRFSCRNEKAGAKNMTYKDIAVYLSDDDHSNERMDAAMELAKQHGANLTGIYVMTQPVIPSFIQAEIPTELIEERIREVKAHAHSRKEAFEGKLEAAGITGTFLLMEGDAVEAAAGVSRYVDLVIAGQPDPDHPVADDAVTEGLLMSSGRPVLVMPYVGKQTDIGKRVMVAWNGTREGSRAVHDGLAMLKQAEEVIVFEVNPQDGAFDANDMCDHLKRHGVNAIAKHTVALDLEISDALLSAISDNSIDLLVMGGYGHSRIRELALGGATREIMHAMTCPVLMSH